MPNVLKIGCLILVAGVVALVMRGLYVSASSATAAPASTEKIRVAASDLPEGLLLRDSDLEWKDVPKHNAVAGAFASSEAPVDIKGALLRHPLVKGAPIMAADVILSSDPGFLSATLKPDMRAVSVGIDAVSGNAGLIQPGDYVDLLLTQELNQQTGASPDKAISSETVVQHVRVLAVGSELQRQKSGPDNRMARTVTMEVTPHTAEVINVAAKLGTLSLALRSFATTHASASAGDQESQMPTPVYAGDISKTSRALPQIAPVVRSENPRVSSGPASVMIFRGSKGGEQNPAVAGSSGSPPPLPTLAGLPDATSTQMAQAQLPR
jgi:pilus assembly protein CpaB